MSTQPEREPWWAWMSRPIRMLVAATSAVGALTPLTIKLGFAALVSSLLGMAVVAMLLEKRASLRRWSAPALIGVFLLAVLSTGFGAVALKKTARGTHLQLRSELVLCPGIRPVCRTVTASLPRGTHVKMLCYEDAIWTDLKRHRWFYIEAQHPEAEGFSHARPVTNQTRTPKCEDFAWMVATSWALSREGEVVVPTADRLDATMKTWSGWSTAFVYQAYNRGAGQELRFFARTAQMTLEQYKKARLLRSPEAAPPRGSMIFFRHGTTGAAGISLGNGHLVMAPSGPNNARLPVRTATLESIGLHQLGYVPPSDLL